VKPRSRDPRTELEKLDDEILDLTVLQIDNRNLDEFERLHVQIMDLKQKRRELYENQK
jgi:hypothetical protein